MHKQNYEQKGSIDPGHKSWLLKTFKKYLNIYSGIFLCSDPFLTRVQLADNDLYISGQFLEQKGSCNFIFSEFKNIVPKFIWWEWEEFICLSIMSITNVLMTFAKKLFGDQKLEQKGSLNVNFASANLLHILDDPFCSQFTFLNTTCQY